MFHPVTNYTSAQFSVPTATLDGWNDSKHLTVQSTAAFTIQMTGAVNLTPNFTPSELNISITPNGGVRGWKRGNRPNDGLMFPRGNY